MFITRKIANEEKLYTTDDSKYFIIVNTKIESYDEIAVDDLTEEHLPNYLIINEKTKAIEFAVDQFPAAIQVANKLELELNNLISGQTSIELESITKQ